MYGLSNFGVKIKNRFSDINLNWLLLEHGNILQDAENENTHDDNSSAQEIVTAPSIGLNVGSNPKKELNIEGYGNEKEKVRNSNESQNSKRSEKMIKQVILLYNDDTFSTYQPNE